MEKRRAAELLAMTMVIVVLFLQGLRLSRAAWNMRQPQRELTAQALNQTTGFSICPRHRCFWEARVSFAPSGSRPNDRFLVARKKHRVRFAVLAPSGRYRTDILAHPLDRVL